jgi:chromatin structure-remodeling complex subunit RSC1/2
MRTGSGNWLAAALESVPEEISSPHLPFTAPLSLKLIEEGQVNGKRQMSDRYPLVSCSLKKLRQCERIQYGHGLSLFESTSPCTELYGQVLLLQVQLPPFTLQSLRSNFDS